MILLSKSEFYYLCTITCAIIKWLPAWKRHMQLLTVLLCNPNFRKSNLKSYSLFLPSSCWWLYLLFWREILSWSFRTKWTWTKWCKKHFMTFRKITAVHRELKNKWVKYYCLTEFTILIEASYKCWFCAVQNKKQLIGIQNGTQIRNEYSQALHRSAKNL